MATAVDRIRSFNRSWTEVLGLLDGEFLETEHTLAEARVIFELAHRPKWERADLRQRLGMDASFLTRVLVRLKKQGFVVQEPSETDGRALNLTLTKAGRTAFKILDKRSTAQIEKLLAPLTSDQRSSLVESLTVISQLVHPTGPDQVQLRGLAPGDIGWVVERHGALYWDEFGWDRDFEALVARIVTDFHANFKPGRENAWIAEVDGARAGCTFCCEKDSMTAQLRILLVEPWARGQRIGSRLVDECVSFARSAGYSRLMLWTNDVLISARRIYEAAGFELVEEEKHHSFGKDLIGQNWELELI